MGGEVIRRILSAITRKPPQIVIAPSRFEVRAMRLNNRNAKAAALYVRVHEILTEGRK